MYVQALRRYPVKSMLGEQVAESEVSERGLTGDRARAVLDVATGKIASAKNPRLWRDLLTIEGARVPGDAELSEVLGREVRLIDVAPPEAEFERSVPERVLAEGLEAEVPYTVGRLGGASPEGTFFDFAPVHLVTTSALGVVGAAALRYRPNLVIATEAEGFVENGWVGRELRIGDSVALQIIARSPRCAVPTLAHGDLGRDLDALRMVAKHNRVPVFAGDGSAAKRGQEATPQPCLGVYARVLRSGRIAEGDSVSLVG
ncbi:MOSC domain-containing protein [Nonomuraea purpurea]|uniref:MOSC domain-containing protein n=1 Tax=Nonomuraea purpurea TaxID=1849276 RepID=A0ABV8GJR3_9ACTN